VRSGRDFTVGNAPSRRRKYVPCGEERVCRERGASHLVLRDLSALTVRSVLSFWLPVELNVQIVSLYEQEIWIQSMPWGWHMFVSDTPSRVLACWRQRVSFVKFVLQVLELCVIKSSKRRR